jgi:hypothetical protein
MGMWKRLPRGKKYGTQELRNEMCEEIHLEEVFASSFS